MRVEPITVPLPPGAVAGLEVRADGSRGSWRCAAVDGRHLALFAGTELRLAIEIDEGWAAASFLRGRTWTGPLPPISAAEARTRAGTWPRRIAEWLATSALTGLHADAWWVLAWAEDTGTRGQAYSTAPFGPDLPWPPPPPCQFEAVLAPARAWAEDWWALGDGPRPGGVIALRAASAPDHGRVLAWRRAAREGVLPPAVLLYNPLIQRYLVVDGHDHLHAALLEGRRPATIACVPIAGGAQSGYRADPNAQMAWVEPASLSGRPLSLIRVDRLNQAARAAYGEPMVRAVLSARRFEGGPAAWNAMVAAELGDDDVLALLRIPNSDPEPDPER